MVEFVIPLVGIGLGRRASDVVAVHAGWVGTALLAGLGLWMLWSASRDPADNEVLARRATTWKGLLFVAIALSIDNLIVGFGLGLTGTRPVLVATTIAVFSMAFSWLGITLGSTARRHWERWAEAGAGVLLLGLAAANGVGWL